MSSFLNNNYILTLDIPYFFDERGKFGKKLGLSQTRSRCAPRRLPVYSNNFLDHKLQASGFLLVTHEHPSQGL